MQEVDNMKLEQQVFNRKERKTQGGLFSAKVKLDDVFGEDVFDHRDSKRLSLKRKKKFLILLPKEVRFLKN